MMPAPWDKDAEQRRTQSCQCQSPRPTPPHPAPTSFMEVVECKGDLSRVEPCVLLRQSSVSLHVVHEVSAVDTLNDKEQPAGGGEGRREGRRGKKESSCNTAQPFYTPHNYIRTH